MRSLVKRPLNFLKLLYYNYFKFIIHLNKILNREFDGGPLTNIISILSFTPKIHFVFHSYIRDTEGLVYW